MTSRNKEPAQGILINLSKCQGDQVLYGHNFVNQAFIRLTITEAEQYRFYQEYKYRAKKVILEARLSFSQFAELITSFNIGLGVPATLIRLGNDRYEEPSLTDETVEVKNEGNLELQQAIASIDAAIETTKNQKMTEKARTAILDSLYAAKQKMADSFPCVQKFFEERIDKLQSDARVEIASFLSLVMEEKGLEKMQNNQENILFLESSKDESK